jgi:hypothetical protein
MGREIKRTTIDGATYQVTQIGSLKSFELVGWLGLKVPDALEAMTKDGAIEERIARALAALFRRLATGELEWFRDEMLTTVEWIRTGEKGLEVPCPVKPIQDDHFANRNLALFRLLAFAVQVNFADFLGGLDLKSFFAETGQKAGVSLSSLTDAIGSTGASIGSAPKQNSSSTSSGR